MSKFKKKYRWQRRKEVDDIIAANGLIRSDGTPLVRGPVPQWFTSRSFQVDYNGSLTFLGGIPYVHLRTPWGKLAFVVHHFGIDSDWYKYPLSAGGSERSNPA